MSPIPRSGDRRQAPRRAEEIHAHYARELLLGSALAAAEYVLPEVLADPATYPVGHPLRALLNAAATYNQAMDAAATSGQ